MMNPTLRQYLDQVALLMHLDRRQKKSLFVKIRAELEEQMEAQPVSDYQQLIEILGPPEAMAAELSELEPFTAQLSSVKRTNRRLWCFVMIAAVAVVLIGVVCIHLALTQPGYYVVETVQIQ